MIQANELRQNNWVLLTKDGFKTSKPYQLTAFDIYKADESDCADISPIELTEDILLKCPQFVFDNMEDTNEDNTWFWFKHRSIAFGSDKSSNFNFVVVRINKEEIIIKYLHDLQNKVYEFTGTELEINL